jgi:hypothetical protein
MNWYSVWFINPFLSSFLTGFWPLFFTHLSLIGMCPCVCALVCHSTDGAQNTIFCVPCVNLRLEKVARFSVFEHKLENGCLL